MPRLPGSWSSIASFCVRELMSHWYIGWNRTEGSQLPQTSFLLLRIENRDDLVSGSLQERFQSRQHFALAENRKLHSISMITIAGRTRCSIWKASDPRPERCFVAAVIRNIDRHGIEPDIITLSFWSRIALPSTVQCVSSLSLLDMRLKMTEWKSNRQGCIGDLTDIQADFSSWRTSNLPCTKPRRRPVNRHNCPWPITLSFALWDGARATPT